MVTMHDDSELAKQSTTQRNESTCPVSQTTLRTLPAGILHFSILGMNSRSQLRSETTKALREGVPTEEAFLAWHRGAQALCRETAETASAGLFLLSAVSQVWTSHLKHTPVHTCWNRGDGASPLSSSTSSSCSPLKQHSGSFSP